MNLELMLEVRRRVLAEPTLVDMRTFYRTVHTGHDCTTAGCIAGHTIIARSGEPRHYDEPDVVAAVMLDLDPKEADALFQFHYEKTGIYDDLYERLKDHSNGTPEYALIVTHAIDRCIIRNTPPESLPLALEAAHVPVTI